MAAKMIKFKSNDGKIIEIDFSLLAEFSNAGQVSDPNFDEIHTIDVHSSTLIFLKEWLKLKNDHKGIPKRSSGEKIKLICEPERRFFERIDGIHLTDFLNLGSILNIPILRADIKKFVLDALNDTGESQQDKSAEALGRDEPDEMETDQPDCVVNCDEVVVSSP